MKTSNSHFQNKGGDTGVDADEDVDASQNDVCRAGHLQWHKPYLGGIPKKRTVLT